MFSPLPNQIDFADYLHQTYGDVNPDIRLRYLVSTRGLKIPYILCCRHPMQLKALTSKHRVILHCPCCGKAELAQTRKLHPHNPAQRQ